LFRQVLKAIRALQRCNNQKRFTLQIGHFSSFESLRQVLGLRDQTTFYTISKTKIMEENNITGGAAETTVQPLSENTADRNLAVLAHAGGIVFGFIPALIIYLMKKDESAFVASCAKEALNFQITIAIAFFVCLVLVFVLIGALLIWLVWLGGVILSIIGAQKASRGIEYKYPCCLRLLK
jgi:uncharacterized Tic20 family protein